MSEPSGKIEEGKRVYLITHAYYHVLCEIVHMLGPQRAEVKNARLVIRSSLSWEDFFRLGCTRDNTVMHTLPPGELSWIDALVWEHPIP